MNTDKLNSICTKKMYFDFYGLKVKVNVTTEKDMELVRFQYITFETKPIEKNDIEFFFLTEDSEFGFFDAVFQKRKDLKKLSYYYQDGALNLYNSFTEWSGKTTPFPPFIFEPLVSRYVYLQGSSVEIENNAYSFLGKPFNGKSTLVNWCLNLIPNAKYLADDITIVNINNLDVEPYHTSSGIREDAKDWFKKISSNQSSVTTISEVTGPVEYHRIEDLYQNKLGVQSKLSGIFILSSDPALDDTFHIQEITKNKNNVLEEYRLPINDFPLEYFDNTNIYKIQYNLQKVKQNELINELNTIFQKQGSQIVA